MWRECASQELVGVSALNGLTGALNDLGVVVGEVEKRLSPLSRPGGVEQKIQRGESGPCAPQPVRGEVVARIEAATVVVNDLRGRLGLALDRLDF